MKHMVQKLVAIIFVLVFSSTVVFATDAITINTIDFEKYVDEFGSEDESLVTVKVSFTAPAGATQVSLLLTGDDITELNDETKTKVIYMDQSITPTDGIYEFAVEKSRIAQALGKESIEGETLYIKMGGKSIAEMVSSSVVYSEPTDTVVYGDINNDGDIDFADAILLLRYDAGITSLTETQLRAGLINDDEDVDFADAIIILKYDAGLINAVK